MNREVRLGAQAVEAAYHFGFPLDAGAVLIVELDGLAAGLDQQGERVMEICRKNRAREVRLAKTAQERADLWKSRKRAFGAIGRLSPNFITQDEESSGVIDISDILGNAGEHVYLLDTQAHNPLGGELVEGGQLMLMRELLV